MSLTLATIAGIIAYRAKKRAAADGVAYVPVGIFDGHARGIDVLGDGYQVDRPADAPKQQAFIQSRKGAYLTSVAAGLTVAGILAAGGYAFAKYSGILNGKGR
jgi:hypothetical protein